MSYEASKDHVLAIIGEFATGKTKLVVKLVAYDGGAKKGLVERFIKTERGWQLGKVGRLHMDEVQQLARLLVLTYSKGMAKQSAEPPGWDSEQATPDEEDILF